MQRWLERRSGLLARSGEMMGSLARVRRFWFGPALLLALFVALGTGTQVRGQSNVDAEGRRTLLPALRGSDSGEARTDSAFVPGEIAVGVRRDVVGAAAVAAAVEASKIESMSLRGLDGADGDGGVDGYLLRVPVGEEWATIERLSADPAVVFAEPNWLVRTAAGAEEGAVSETAFDVNDPLYEGGQWYMQRILASRAWALSGLAPGAAPKVAASLPIEVVVVDSGVDHTHGDLAGRISLQGRNYVDPGQLPVDDCGHGTHVAGLIAAGINNERGIAGGAADVRVAAYKTLSWEEDESQPGGFSCRGPVSNVVNAIEDAADAGVDIINLSLELDQPWQPLEAAVNYARSRGVLVIGAAGNCLSRDCAVKYPARYDAVLAVAATDYYNFRTAYSPKGDELDLAAPGGSGSDGILSTWPADVRDLCPGDVQWDQGDLYCEDVGTSMASGVATGAAALAWSVRTEMDAEAVRDLLEETTRPLPYDGDEVGDGLVDADRAVRYALRSRLDVQPRTVVYGVTAGAESFETTLLLENPSLEPVTWLITETADIGWLDVGVPYSGTVRYGEPGRAPVVISATHLVTGAHRASFSVEGERENGSRMVIPVEARLTVVAPAGTPSLLPLIGGAPDEDVDSPFVPYQWELPDDSGRMDVAVLKDSSIGVTLPVTITVGDRQYTDARIYSDGYVVAPASERMDRANNQCLPSTAVDGLALFGWWGDLDPAQRDGRVSVFRAGPDRSVVEFANVFVGGGATAQRVTFQIVLYEDGRVGMNYQRTPSPVGGADGGPVPGTVGMQRLNGRFFNQVGCVADESRFGRIEVGQLPQSYQSLLFREEDLF